MDNNKYSEITAIVSGSIVTNPVVRKSKNGNPYTTFFVLPEVLGKNSDKENTNSRVSILVWGDAKSNGIELNPGAKITARGKLKYSTFSYQKNGETVTSEGFSLMTNKVTAQRMDDDASQGNLF